MVLYKYFSPGLIQVIESGRLRYSPPSVLNDPFELKPHITAIASGDEIKKKYLELIMPHIPSLKASFLVKTGRAITDNEMLDYFLGGTPIDYVVEQVNRKSFQAQELVAEQLENIGMLCLTEKFDNLLMWAHYAASHTGFVLGFDTSHPHFHQRRSDKDELRHVRKVEYTDLRPTTVLVDGPSYDVFISKGRVWEYEQEWRILRSLRDADEIKEVPGHKVPIHLFDYPRECLVSIILGARMNQSDQSQIVKLISNCSQLSHVEVFKAEVSDRLFALDITRI